MNRFTFVATAFVFAAGLVACDELEYAPNRTALPVTATSDAARDAIALPCLPILTSDGKKAGTHCVQEDEEDSPRVIATLLPGFKPTDVPETLERLHQDVCDGEDWTVEGPARSAAFNSEQPFVLTCPLSNQDSEPTGDDDGTPQNVADGEDSGSDGDDVEGDGGSSTDIAEGEGEDGQGPGVVGDGGQGEVNIDEEDVEVSGLAGCETAYAFGDTAFDELVNTRRWGWSIGSLEPGTHTTEIWAAAGQGDTDKGVKVGTLEIDYDGSSAIVTYSMASDVVLNETHLYVGSEELPKAGGKATVAPGKYGHGHELDGVGSDSFEVYDLSGDIHVVAHAVVCPAE